MKKFMKELSASIILAFTIGFMLFIYEPIIMYSNNMSDFWFDIYTLFSCNIIVFFACFISILIIFILIYFIGRFILRKKPEEKKNIIYYLFLLTGFTLFIVTYIQGNFLSGSLPVLDGNAIVWNSFKTQTIISVCLLVFITTLIVVCTIKFKYIKTIKFLKYITLAIFVMLLISLVSTCLTRNCFIRKDYVATPTTKNINVYSSNKNFIILLLDNMDSERTQKILDENPEFKEIFADFTYFPDTVGGYVFTRDSVPLVLTGNWNENTENYSVFFNKAMRNSKLLNMLKEKNYDTNLYEEFLVYNSNDTDQIKNLSFDTEINKLRFFKEESKYILFKYLPFYLKPYSTVETMDFNSTKTNNDEYPRFVWDNTVFYYDLLSQNVKVESHNQFKYIHLEGPHPPFDCNEDLQSVESGTYEQKVIASLKIIDTYLKYLKENNVYDNSTIIIMADHGYEYPNEELVFRHNPIFYVKGYNEQHELKNSDGKVWYGDLMEIYENLLEDKTAEHIRAYLKLYHSGNDPDQPLIYTEIKGHKGS